MVVNYLKLRFLILPLAIEVLAETQLCITTEALVATCSWGADLDVMRL